MCRLIRLHVDMLTLFKTMLTKESMPIQKVKMENGFALACGNKHDGAILILCIVPNILFTSLFVSQIIKCINMCDFLQLCKYYVIIICTKGKKDHV